jgi:tRNA nucleotidyltransferase (CCA-adding enzyme)
MGIASNRPRWWENWVHGRVRAAAARAEARLRGHVWPPEVLSVLDRLRDGGGQAYLVGGTVRDALLGRAGGAWDVATDRKPSEVMERFERVVPTGILHGTVLILAEGLQVECTTLRREGTYSDARRPDAVQFTADPLEDLERRDLTVNAMAFDPASGRLLDPEGGAADLERGCLRSVGDPLERFREDALRPLRVARLAAVLEMEPEAGLRAALAECVKPDSGVRLDAVSPERVRDELFKMLGAPRPSVGLELLRVAGLLAMWLPELEHCFGQRQNRFHAYDVYFHSLATCDAAPAAKPAVRWAALLHDIGKPDTFVERDGDGTFYRHEEVGAVIADRLLERLRVAGETRSLIVHLIREHMFEYRPEWSDAALRRWLRRVGPMNVADLFDLRIADALGNGLRRGFPSYLLEMRTRVEQLLESSRAFEVADLAVDGHDVMRELGIAPGPRVREALEGLLEEVLDRPERNNATDLVTRLREWRDAAPRTS